MGAERTDYVMLAAKLEYDTLDYESLDDYLDNPYSKKINSHNGLTAISDGMNGEYLFIGKVLAKSVGDEGISSICPIPKGSSEIKERLKSQFGIVNSIVCVWIFTHWY